jgi:hypothetical protein
MQGALFGFGGFLSEVQFENGKIIPFRRFSPSFDEVSLGFPYKKGEPFMLAIRRVFSPPMIAEFAFGRW